MGADSGSEVGLVMRECRERAKVMMTVGSDLFSHVEALFPICRSITGDGLRRTLGYVASHIPLEVHEVPSGTKVLDWEIPPEWTARGATLRTLSDQVLLDFSKNNLHLVQYSKPIERTIDLAELQTHLHSIPEQPDLIPYRTAYYTDTWGFCLADRDRKAMADEAYKVHIDTSLAPGHLSYGECFLPGDEDGEVLISVHCCHPSLANDNLSGISVAIGLVQGLERRRRRFGYRFVFIPGTIGAITWLHFNRDVARRVRHGLVLTCVGDPAPPTYKRSRGGQSPIDRYAGYVLADEGHADRVVPFIPYGYDERQYCSPGFNLPVGCFMRSQHGSFTEYHTSADNLSFVKSEALGDSLRVVDRILTMAEQDRTYLNTQPFGEPQLGRRGLYRMIGGQHSTGSSSEFDQMTLLWVLNLADGDHSLLDIAERSGCRFEAVAAAAEALKAVGLLGAGETGIDPAAGPVFRPPR
jgi:aminopeptidase-like protein